jgi:hypothetical protein
LELQGEGGHGIPLGMLHLVWSHIPPYSGAAQPLAGWLKGPDGWNLAGVSRNVVKISDKKPSDTWRSGELRFYFTPVVPDGFTLLI